MSLREVEEHYVEMVIDKCLDAIDGHDLRRLRRHDDFHIYLSDKRDACRLILEHYFAAKSDGAPRFNLELLLGMASLVWRKQTADWKQKRIREALGRPDERLYRRLLRAP